MNSKVKIIHGSSIVQMWLSDILNRNFKCSVNCYLTFEAFLAECEKCTEKCILFTEDSIANSEVYLKYINEIKDITSFCIVNGKIEKTIENSPYSLFIYDSPEKIYELVKLAFQEQDINDEESEGLSNREIDVLKLVALGFANKEIAEKLFISTHTVMSHRKNMTEKLGIKSISGLTVYAIINNYIDTTNLDIKDLI